MPLDHVGINVPDAASAREYYDELMPLVGFTPFVSGEGWFSYRPVDWNGAQLFFYTAREDGPYSRHRPGLQHLCFLVETRAEVHSAHQWALRRGDEVLDEPQPFPQYHRDYYAVFWTDPRGFKIEVCCVNPPE
jgi:catechol 2,3-dioxygenase-like lactoylglutathione lyase family enzyme